MCIILIHNIYLIICTPTTLLVVNAFTTNTSWTPIVRFGLSDYLLCNTNVTFGVYRFWRAYIDGYSGLGVAYEVSLEVVMTTHA